MAGAPGIGGPARDGLILAVALNPSLDKTLVVPGFVPGSVARATRVHSVPGGKGVNVARVVRALGHPVRATGLAVGPGGQRLAGMVAALGIDAAFLPVAPGAPTEGRSGRDADEPRTCLTILDPDAGTQTELREPGPAVPPEVLEAFLDHFRRLLAGASVVVLSGSLPPGLAPDAYAHLVAAARAAGVPAILDAAGEPLTRALVAGPAMVKPNAAELAELTGRPVDPGASPAALVEACRGILREGTGAVAASFGADGAILVGEAEAWRAVPPRLPPVNTVGSGDAMVAGLAVGLAQGRAAPDLLRLGVACGAANALTPGVAEVRPDLVVRLLPMVHTEVVA